MENAGPAVESADVIFFAVKPQEFQAAATDVVHALDGQLVISCMAGVKIATLRDYLRIPKIVRVMPNTPAYVREAMSVWTCTDSVPESDRRMTESLLEALGQQIFVEDEKYIDMATALSASGLLSRKMGGPGVYPPMPAEVFSFTQAKKAWPTSKGEDRYRRGLYTFIWRQSQHHLLTTFDGADAQTAAQ